MGIAMWSTVLAIFITTYGCFALSTDPRIVRATYWAYARGTNTSSGEEFEVHLGLRSAVLTSLAGGGRAEQSLLFGLPPPFDRPADESGNPLVDNVLADCREAAVGNQVGSFLSCFTLIFALSGTINRMKFVSDTNIQKTLGMVTDTWGAFSLTYTMLNFFSLCYADLDTELGLLRADYHIGPGWCADEAMPI